MTSSEWKGYSVSVPSYYTESDPKPHAVYSIQVIRERKRWRVNRRYNEFHYFHDKLMELFPTDVTMLYFPPKKLIGNMDPKFLEDRRRGLEMFLQGVVSRYQPASSDIVRQFLQFPEVSASKKEVFLKVPRKKKADLEIDPPLGQELLNYKSRQEKLKKSVPKHLLQMRSQPESRTQAEELVKAMLITMISEGAYFRVTKMQSGSEGESHEGPRMFVRYSGRSQALEAFTPAQGGGPLPAGVAPAISIPIASICSVTGVVAKRIKNIPGGDGFGERSTSPFRRTQSPSVFPLTKNLVKSRKRAGRETVMEKMESTMVVRLTFTETHLKAAEISDEEDEIDEGEGRLKASTEKVQMLLDMETFQFDDGIAFADGLKLVMKEDKAVSECTATETKMLTDILGELAILDVDLSLVPKDYDPEKPPSLPDLPQDYEFAKGKLGTEDDVDSLLKGNASVEEVDAFFEKQLGSYT